MDQDEKNNIDDFSLEFVFDHSCDLLKHEDDQGKEEDYIVKLIFRDPFGRIVTYETEEGELGVKVTR